MLAATALAAPRWRLPLLRAAVSELGRAMTETLDDMVLAVAREADRAAFARLFDHAAPRLKAYLLRLGCESAQADELVQDIMLTVWRRAGSFDPRQAAASTWIFTIARNRRIDGLRRQRRPELDPEDPVLVGDPEPPADSLLAQQQSAERLRAALNELPGEQADLLHLAYFEETPHSRIAALRELPLGTVKSRIRLALARLREALAPEDRPT